MPKTYSKEERQFITEQLHLHAAECLRTYGIKKTTVDELVKRAKIPKGTFYLFYKSKELLLFEVFLKWHDDIQSDFIQSVAKLKQPLDVDQLTDVLLLPIKQVESTGLIHILHGGQLELFMRKLPPEMVNEHFAHDHNTLQQLVTHLGLPKTKDLDTFSAAFRGLFLLLLHKDEIGPSFDEVMRLAVRGIVIQLLE